MRGVLCHYLQDGHCLLDGTHNKIFMPIIILSPRESNELTQHKAVDWIDTLHKKGIRDVRMPLRDDTGNQRR